MEVSTIKAMEEQRNASSSSSPSLLASFLSVLPSKLPQRHRSARPRQPRYTELSPNHDLQSLHTLSIYFGPPSSHPSSLSLDHIPNYPLRPPSSTRTLPPLPRGTPHSIPSPSSPPSQPHRETSIRTRPSFNPCPQPRQARREWKRAKEVFLRPRQTG